MANDVQVNITGDSAKAVAEINKTAVALQKLMVVSKSGVTERNVLPIPENAPEQFTQLGKAARIAGEESEKALGITRREWMRTGTEAAYYMTAIAGKSGETGQAIGKMTGMVTQLGESFMFGGMAGVAIAAVGLGISLLVAQNPKIQALNDELTKLGKQNESAQTLARLAGVSEQQAAAALNAAKENQAYAAMLQQLTADANAPIGVMGLLGDAIGDVVEFMQSGIEAGGQFVALLLGTAAAGASLIASFKDGRSAEEANAAAMATMRNVMMGTTEQTEKRTSAQKRLEAAVIDAGIVEDRLTRAALNEGELYELRTENANSYADALKKVASAQTALLQGMVETALTPTKVTDQDVEDTKQGKYKNKWDEFARRGQAVLAGADPAQFGDKFQKALAGLNMPLDQAIEKFKNFSLFADPANLKLVDWESMTASIGEQLQGLVGKANLMKEGFAKAWAGLSADQKKSLRELGIQSSGDAKDALMGAADSGVKGFLGGMNNKDTAQSVKDAGTTLVNNVRAGIMGEDTQKAWGETMSTLIDLAVGKLTDKDNFKKLYDAGALMLQQLAGGLRESTALGDAMMNAVSDAIQEAIDWLKDNFSNGTPPAGAPPTPPPGGKPKGQALGGFGVARAGELFRADAGEQYWFGGKHGQTPFPGGGGMTPAPITVNVNYSSQFSLSTRQEAMAVLVPLITEGLRKVERRKLT